MLLPVLHQAAPSTIVNLLGQIVAEGNAGVSDLDILSCLFFYLSTSDSNINEITLPSFQILDHPAEDSVEVSLPVADTTETSAEVSLPVADITEISAEIIYTLVPKSPEHSCD